MTDLRLCDDHQDRQASLGSPPRNARSLSSHPPLDDVGGSPSRPHHTPGHRRPPHLAGGPSTHDASPSVSMMAPARETTRSLSLLLHLLLLAALSLPSTAFQPSEEPIRTTREPDLVTASPSQESSSTTTTPAQNLSTTTTTTTTTITTTTTTIKAPTPVVEEVAAPVFSATARNNSMLNITAQLGSSVFLPCVTHHSMERQVSWVRRRDWHILTSGLLTYTKEGRFTMHHTEGSTKWTLAIKYLKLEDEGVYECQISTGGGVVAQLVNLTVVEPRAVIPGSGEHHVQSGSTISLVCYIEQAPARPQSPVAPQYIFWYHNSRMINYDRERGGVKVNIQDGKSVRSHLTVTKATRADSGNYTCSAANTRAASITVYVTEDNQIAAIQPYAVDAAGTQHSCLALLVVVVVVAEMVCLATH